MTSSGRRSLSLELIEPDFVRHRNPFRWPTGGAGSTSRRGAPAGASAPRTTPRPDWIPVLAVNFLLLGAVLFSTGVYGVLARRNAVMVLMSVELILNSVNLNLVAFALMNGNADGQIFAL